MADAFRIVTVQGNQEVKRFVDLIGACVAWVRDPKKLRVERVPVGSIGPGVEITSAECCSVLRQWLPTNKHFTSDDERKDMAVLIQEACEGTRQKVYRSEPTF